jgi:putative endonuclease
MLKPQPYFVYVLWSDVGMRFYIGLTEDIDHRIEQHNSGKSRWTTRYAGTWMLVWRQQFSSLGLARRFENRLKKQKGGNGFLDAHWARSG